MTRSQALEIAKEMHQSWNKAQIDAMFGRRLPISRADEWRLWGFRNGWFRVGPDHAFSIAEITGEQYDTTQAGWAFI